ncbi:MAG: N-acetylmuramoyl-L-alanine amidase [Akkermansiaceae bacterium]|nr:N-acetylmuramoyl-L-alanine amidase [Akkermansiaceae bacterium]MCD8071149.1 N-acetylmuramoyl-L-alanine amidase [Akkermansiaceae bacterium]
MDIAIDIGHANGTGARGNGLEEHEVCTEIARYLGNYLIKADHEVVVLDYPEETNSSDLNKTIAAANAGGFNFGISLHCDCSDNSEAHGAHVCYISDKGKELASSIARHLAALLPGRSETVQLRTDLAVLKRTNPVWVLCECGFISNAADAKIQSETPELIASAIAKGVNNYCS